MTTKLKRSPLHPVPGGILSLKALDQLPDDALVWIKIRRVGVPWFHPDRAEGFARFLRTSNRENYIFQIEDSGETVGFNTADTDLPAPRRGQIWLVWLIRGVQVTIHKTVMRRLQ